jgi:hypothetical protein
VRLPVPPSRQRDRHYAVFALVNQYEPGTFNLGNLCRPAYSSLKAGVFEDSSPRNLNVLMEKYWKRKGGRMKSGPAKKTGGERWAKGELVRLHSNGVRQYKTQSLLRQEFRKLIGLAC